MTENERTKIRRTLEECEQTILAMLRPLIIYKLVLETQVGIGQADDTTAPMLALIDHALDRAGVSLGVNVVEADLLATRSIWYGEEPTIQGLIQAA